MKAARIHEYGPADVIRFEEMPRPSPGRGQVVIRVAAAAFNPSDIGFRSGLLRDVVPLELPFVPGLEASGTVVELGAGVETFEVGARVVGLLDGGGAAAEFVTAVADRLVAAPSSIPLAHSAAIPVAGLTAWQALFEQAHVEKGQRILINGAGGGVGMFAVQLARHAGATVIATASPRSAAAVRGYGAEQIVDYTAGSVASAVGDRVDAVLNLAVVGPEVIASFTALLRPGGALVSVTVPVEPPGVHMIARNDVGQLAELVRLVDTGVLQVDVTESHPLADLAKVHRRGEQGLTRGKVIVVP